MKKVTKAVFPVAGLGTRFLPATKASPKEMMPIVDKPLIQYAVEEAVAAGITDMIFVTGRSKRAIEDHFDKAYELETELEVRGKTQTLEFVRNILPKNINCIYIRQAEALGLGHAVLCAEPAVNDEPFVVILADDLIISEVAVLKQMGDAFDFHRGSLLGVEEVPKSDTEKYGIVKVENNGGQVSRIVSIVEKPKPAVAPSNLAVVGRYVLTPRLFDHLRRIGQGAGGEIQLTDGIASLMGQEAVYAHRFVGKRYDCGSKLGYLEATVEQALRHPALHKDFRNYLIRLSHQLEPGGAHAEGAGAGGKATASKPAAKKAGRKGRTRIAGGKGRAKARS
jgi:UTP--glucose-1-phosphate uridylyltransferase